MNCRGTESASYASITTEGTAMTLLICDIRNYAIIAMNHDNLINNTKLEVIRSESKDINISDFTYRNPSSVDTVMRYKGA